MKAKEIKKLIEMVEQSHISELEVSRWGRKVCIRKYAGNNLAASSVQGNMIVAPAPSSSIPVQAPTTPKPGERAVEAPLEEERRKLVDIGSPMVGTFYRAPAPDAVPYVEVGDTVSEGQVLCIIEAMKLMNEIEAEFPCRIVEILVDNAQPVEYNQTLFKVEKI